jgi:hypothetical protein
VPARKPRPVQALIAGRALARGRLDAPCEREHNGQCSARVTLVCSSDPVYDRSRCEKAGCRVSCVRWGSSWRAEAF